MRGDERGKQLALSMLGCTVSGASRAGLTPPSVAVWTAGSVPLAGSDGVWPSDMSSGSSCTVPPAPMSRSLSDDMISSAAPPLGPIISSTSVSCRWGNEADRARASGCCVEDETAGPDTEETEPFRVACAAPPPPDVDELATAFLAPSMMVAESPVPFRRALVRSICRWLFSSLPPMTQVRLSCALSPLLCNLFNSVDSRSGKTGISSHMTDNKSSLSGRRASARYSHARCCSSASSTCVYRSKMLMRWSLISGNRLTHYHHEQSACV